jgi:hypothetical protein
MFMAWEVTIFRVKVMLMVTTKTYACLQHKKIEWFPDKHRRLQQPNKIMVLRKQNGKLLRK